MNNQDKTKTSYDVASISRSGSEKRTNYIQDALQVSKQTKISGQFVRVFADIFLKREAGNRSYF